MPFPLNRRLTVAERNRIVNMLATDTNPKKIADDTHCSYHTVMRIKRNLKLFDNHTPPIKARQGRPPKLNETVLEALKNYVTEKPSARLDEMVRYLQDEFQVKVDESTVSRTIRLHQWRAPMGGSGAHRDGDSEHRDDDTLDPALEGDVDMGGDGEGLLPSHDAGSPPSPRPPNDMPPRLMNIPEQRHSQEHTETRDAPIEPTSGPHDISPSARLQKHSRKPPSRSVVDSPRPTISISSVSIPIVPSSPSAQMPSSLPSHLSPQQLQNHFPPHLRTPMNNPQIIRSPIVPHQSLLRPTSPAPPVSSNPRAPHQNQNPHTPQQNPQSLTLPPPSPILPPKSPQPPPQQQPPAPPAPVTPATPAPSSEDTIIALLREQNQHLMRSQEQQSRELAELRREVTRLTGIFTGSPQMMGGHMQHHGHQGMNGHMGSPGQGHMGSPGQHAFGQGMHQGGMHGHNISGGGMNMYGNGNG